MTTRRTIIKTAVYAAPAIVLTLAATPAFAGKGSATPPHRQKREKEKPAWLMQIFKHKREEA